MDRTSDFLSFLVLWRECQQQKKTLSNNQFRKYCREYFLSYMRLKDWQDIRLQLRDVAKTLKLSINTSEAGDDAIHNEAVEFIIPSQ